MPTVNEEQLLSDWMPSDAAIELIKLNGITDEQIAASLHYIKTHNELYDIEHVEGYDSWNSFFIMFCINANKLTNNKN